MVRVCGFRFKYGLRLRFAGRLRVSGCLCEHNNPYRACSSGPHAEKRIHIAG